MALLYPWATKEYLLWDMSLGQIVLYHNLGIDMKYGGSGGDGKRTLRDMTPEEVTAARDEARRQLGIGAEDDAKEKLREKYGDI